MAKFKRYDYSQKVFIPISLENQLVPGTLEFIIHTLIENRLDMSVFEDRYNNDHTGRSAYDPKILLKIILLGYSRGLYSSRSIERACKENVIFMALTCQTFPDHSTIAAFVSSAKDEIPQLFTEVLLVCQEENLLGGTFFALDGCKLPSNASMHKSGKINDLLKKRDSLKVRVQQLIEQQIAEDLKDKRNPENSFDQKKRERQIERLQKKADRIEKWLEENDAKIGRQGREIKSNITDNESGTMVSSHGTVQGYNSQALVDDKHQVIIQAEVFGDGQDYYHIEPLVDGAKATMKAIGHPEDYFKGTILTADALYHSKKSLEKCIAEGIDAYIPDKNYRKRDPNLKTKKPYRGTGIRRLSIKDFVHDEDNDVYKCPQGNTLNRKSIRVSDGILYHQYVTTKGSCDGCEIKIRCILRNGKQKYLNVPVERDSESVTKQMIDKIDSAHGKRIYNRRFGIVEPVFGNIRSQKRLNRFTLRGKIKVNIQWMLYCMVHNIEKIMRYGIA